MVSFIFRLPGATTGIIKGDGSYKLCKKAIAGPFGRPASVTYTLMNGHNAIVGQWNLGSESSAELGPLLEKVRRRFILLGVKDLIVYTDLCCKEGVIWQRAFGDLLIKFEYQVYSNIGRSST